MDRLSLRKLNHFVPLMALDTVRHHNSDWSHQLEVSGQAAVRQIRQQPKR